MRKFEIHIAVRYENRSTGFLVWRNCAVGNGQGQSKFGFSINYFWGWNMAWIGGWLKK